MANEEHAPNGTTAPLVLVGWDQTDHSRDALALAGVLARVYGLRVRVASVYEIYQSYPFLGEMIEVVRDEADSRMRDVPTQLLGGVESEMCVVPGTSPAEGLTREAERCHARIVVVGSTHRGPIGRVLPGTTASHLLHGAPCAVAVAPAGYATAAPQQLNVIAAAYGASRESRDAVEEAAVLAKRARGTVRVITCVPPTAVTWVPVAAYAVADISQTQQAYFRDKLSEVVGELPTEIRAQGRLREGVPSIQILEECAAGVDLLVMGSRGYGTVRRVLLGSVSAEVVKSAPCPVLVIPRGDPVHETEDRREAGAVA